MSFDGIDDFFDISNTTNIFENQGSISIDFKIPNESDWIDEYTAYSGANYGNFVNPTIPLFTMDNGYADPFVIRIGDGCYAENVSLSIEDDDCGQSNPSVRASWGDDPYLLFDDQWHNITITIDDDGHTLYLDGVQLILNYSLGIIL